MREPRHYESPLCAEVDINLFYPEDLDEDKQLGRLQAQRICAKCIHKDECAEWGIVNEEFGIWGGLTMYQRRLERRRRKIKVRDYAKDSEGLG